MKVGDLVTNVMPVRTNPMTPGRPIERGAIGVVAAIRPDKWNPTIPTTNYVDVLLSSDGEDVWLGNYGAGFFEVIS